MSHTFNSLSFHVIFSTKDRVPCIDAAMQARLFPYIGGILREIGGKALMINGTADHVHILATLPPALNVSDVLRVVKANSSGWVHETLGKRTFAWQTGYGAFSVSHSNLNSVTEYIANQVQHHKHGVKYDERYVWG